MRVATSGQSSCTRRVAWNSCVGLTSMETKRMRNRWRLSGVILLMLGLAVSGKMTAADPEGDDAILNTAFGDMRVVTSAGQFHSIRLVSPPADAPTTHVYPLGFVGLTIKKVPRGGDATLTFHLPAGLGANVAMKCMPGAGCAPYP